MKVSSEVDKMKLAWPWGTVIVLSSSPPLPLPFSLNSLISTNSISRKASVLLEAVYFFLSLFT